MATSSSRWISSIRSWRLERGSTDLLRGGRDADSWKGLRSIDRWVSSGGAEEGRSVGWLIPASWELGCVGSFPEGSAFIEEIFGVGG